MVPGPVLGSFFFFVPLFISASFLFLSEFFWTRTRTQRRQDRKQEVDHLVPLMLVGGADVWCGFTLQTSQLTLVKVSR